jgi:hypothetical protein
MAYLKPLKLKKKKKSPFNWKKFMPLILGALMVGSVLVAFTYQTTSDKAGLRVVRVDPVLGNPEDLFNSEVELAGNITALQLVRGAGFSAQVENGTFECISNLCNGAQSWEFYVNGLTPIEPADELIVNSGDQVFLVFR